VQSVEAAGHAPQLEQPEKVARMVADFVGAAGGA
jgi:pimeloyl-ACP methyl ester carboxylesterase